MLFEMELENNVKTQLQTVIILMLTCIRSTAATTIFLHTTLSPPAPYTSSKITLIQPTTFITNNGIQSSVVSSPLPSHQPSSTQTFSSIPLTQTSPLQSNVTTLIVAPTKLVSTPYNTPLTLQISTTLHPDFNRCLQINTSSTGLAINTTETVRGTVLKAVCQAPYYINSRIGDKKKEDVFKCEGGLWKPYSPRCLEDSSDTNGGVVAGVVIGVILGLFIIGGSGFLFYKMFKHKEFIENKKDEIQTKMFRLNDFVYSNNKDYIGMPVVSFKSRNPDLRGVPLEEDEEEPEVNSTQDQEETLPYF